MFNLKDIIDYLKIRKNDVTITTLPMAYSFGLSILNSHLERGSAIILNNDPVFSKNFWSKVNRFKVCSFGTVPIVYEYLKRINLEKFLTSSIKYLTVAGGKTDKRTLKYLLEVCKKNKTKFFVMYGQTEASPRMSYLNLNKNPEKLESIGKPLKDSKFEIYKNELIFYGDNVSLGYAKNIKDLIKGDVNKGKLKTGDLGYKDNDNFFYIIGRKKRISKLFGLRIDLGDIEKTLKKNNLNIKIITDDNKIKLLTSNILNAEKIKNLIKKNFKINKNFIEVIDSKDEQKNTNFKNSIKL